MGIVVDIVDAIVLLLFVVLIPRFVWRELSGGSGSLFAAIGVAVFTIVFAWVSFTSLAGFFVSTLAQVIWLLILLLMAYLVCISCWPAKTSR